MFSLFKRKNTEIEDVYNHIMDDARAPKLYEDYGVEDKPAMRFQMIALHAVPYMLRYSNEGQSRKSQALFDMIFRDVELSFREIGVGDLAVPKKMKKYMQIFNGVVQVHAAANADHVGITKRHVCDEGQSMPQEFQDYIRGLFYGV